MPASVIYKIINARKNSVIVIFALSLAKHTISIIQGSRKGFTFKQSVALSKNTRCLFTSI